MRQLSTALMLAVIGVLMAFAAKAQDVTLRTSDGAVKVSGTLLTYDGDYYKIRSAFGDLTLNSAGVICSGHACPNPSEFATTVAISVSHSIGDVLLPALIEDYVFQNGQSVIRQQDGGDLWDFHVTDPTGHPVSTVQLAVTDTLDGFTNLIDQKADLNVSFRQADGSEVARARQAGIGNLTNASRKHILALDGLIFITSRQNPIRSLSVTQIADVFSGVIQNWSEVGGIDAPINLYIRNQSADLTALFHSFVWPAASDRSFAPGAVFMSNSSLSDAVANDPFAIGFTNFSGIRNARALALDGPCGNKITASAFNLKAEDYPMTQHLYLYTPKKRPTGFIRGFFAYLDGPTAQKTIASLGYVGRDVSQLPLTAQGGRLGTAIANANSPFAFAALQDMTAAISGASRLSTTFRFKQFSSELDTRSLNNATVLARLVEQGEFDGKTLLIAGFSDGQGSDAGNQEISRRRALQVAVAIKSAASKADLSKVTFETVGFGEVSPLGCDETEWGRRINRRVEVWLK